MSFSKVAWIVGAALAVAGSLGAAPQKTCATGPQVLAPSEPKETREFRTWLWRQKFSKEDYLPEEMLEAQLAWRADINNDGSPEWVVADHQGSGGYLYLLIFQGTGPEFKAGRIYQEVPWPEGVPKRDGGWYDHDARDFLVKTCGKTYMVFQGPLQQSLEGYLWEKGKNRRACDAAFTSYVSSKFQESYDEKNFISARNVLSSHFEACRTQLDEETRLKMESDLAVTALRLQDYADCLAWVGKAEKEGGFSASRWKKALLYNAGVCTAKKEQPIKTDYGSMSPDSAGFYQSLIATSVPHLDFSATEADKRSRHWKDIGIISESGVPYDHLNYNLREALILNLWLGDRDTLLQERYRVLSGCRPHDCGSKGLLWVDTKTGVSAFALNSSYFAKNTNCYTLGSRTQGFAALPKEFWREFEAWKKRNASEYSEAPACSYFVDGTRSEVSILSVNPQPQ